MKRQAPKDSIPHHARKRNFFELVYAAVAQVPYGRVTTYSSIARYLNNPRGSRAVGWAMRQCPYPNSEVPCPRVINADGTIGGYGPEGQRTKIQLLKKEGIRICQGKVDLERYCFSSFHSSPEEEISLD
jgi:methylated-DNA-protein-cysteine methyltransferase-like protein